MAVGIPRKADRKCREGRALEDYKTYADAHPGLDLVEMDSVEGEKEERYC